MIIHRTSLICAALLIAISITLAIPPAQAQAPKKKNAIDQELVRTETGFFEAWKSKDLAYFRNHIPENGVFWGEYGTASRDQQLEEQKGSAGS